MSNHVIFPTFPCVICGRRYETEAEYIAECDRLRQEVDPKLVEHILNIIREDYEIEREAILDNTIRKFRLKEHHDERRSNSISRRTKG